MNPKKSTIVILAITIALVIGVSSAFGVEDSVIYRFKGSSDGAAPYAGMIVDPAGNLYGTTVDGGGGSNCGTVGCGTVFSLAPGSSWKETVLYSFSGGSDGGNPWGSLILDKSGNLYGTTAGGGIANCSGFSGCGTVFELSPPAAPGGAWTETVLYSFGGSDDGANPWAGVIMDSKGNLYGTTRYGGSVRNAGTVFGLSPPAAPGGAWTETLLHIFGNDNDGANPVSALTFGLHGSPYGVTSSGRGTSQYGIVFRLKPPATQGGSWAEGVLYQFSGGSDGANPLANLIVDKAGNFYGTTSSGGLSSNGVVFELSPSGSVWKQTVLYTFTGGNDGSIPVAALVADKSGNLYGTTTSGGQDKNGSVFELSPGTPWTETTLYDFVGGRDGEEPNGALVFGRGGHLFGTTPSGGAPYGVGTVFALLP